MDFHDSVSLLINMLTSLPHDQCLSVCRSPSFTEFSPVSFCLSFFTCAFSHLSISVYLHFIFLCLSLSLYLPPVPHSLSFLSFELSLPRFLNCLYVSLFILPFHFLYLTVPLSFSFLLLLQIEHL